MRELRLGTWLVTAAALSALGCENRPAEPDTGVSVMDSGSEPDSGGGGTDSGVDSGGGGRTCRPPMSECDLLAQDCGPGRACRYVTPSPSEDPRGLCEEPAGTATEGMPCMRDAAAGVADTCAEGLICDAGTCRQYCCDGNSADCPVGQFCLGGPGDVSLCRTGAACNVFDGSGCTAAGQSCYLAGADRDCFDTGTLPEGMACMFLNHCVPGHACIGEPGAGQCRQLCDPAMAGADCPTTGTYMCVMLTGVTGVGACVPMM